MDRKVLGALVAALVLSLASCGGSGTLSRADFVKQANVICKRRSAQIAAIQARHRNDFRGSLREAIPIVGKNLDALKALKPPSDLKTRFDELVAIERAQLARIRQAISGHPARQGESVALIHKQARLKADLGLTSCT